MWYAKITYVYGGIRINYRILGRTGISVSEIGFGCEGMVEHLEWTEAFIDEMKWLGHTCTPPIKAILDRLVYSMNDIMAMKKDSSLGRQVCCPYDDMRLSSRAGW